MTLASAVLELEDGRRVLICRDCGERIARSFKLGTEAAEAVLSQCHGERRGRTGA